MGQWQRSEVQKQHHIQNVQWGGGGGGDVKFRKLGLKTEEMSSSVIPQLATLLATTAHITWLVNICLHTNFLH